MCFCALCKHEHSDQVQAASAACDRVCSLLCVVPGAVLDESANILFLSELWRGLSITLKAFFDKKVTVRL